MVSETDMVSPELFLSLNAISSILVASTKSVFSAGSATETASTSGTGKASITSTFSAECAGEEAPTSGVVRANFLSRFLGRTSLVHKEIFNSLEVDCSSQWKLDLLSAPNKILSFREAPRSAGVRALAGADGKVIPLCRVLGFRGALHDESLEQIFEIKSSNEG